MHFFEKNDEDKSQTPVLCTEKFQMQLRHPLWLK